MRDRVEQKYRTYIMASRTGTLYIGSTSEFYVRVMQHKTGEIEGFSRTYKCDRLVYYESYDDARKAVGRERQLKGWTRAKKIALIESVNPRWKDLAENWGREMLFSGREHQENALTRHRRGQTFGVLRLRAVVLPVGDNVEALRSDNVEALRSG